MYQNYNYLNFVDRKFSEVINYNNTDKNTLMLLTHYLYQIIDKLKLNLLIHTLFWLVLIFSVNTYFFRKSCVKASYCILFTSSVYLIHYLLLPIVHGSVQERYLFITEFVVYLNAFIGVFFINKICYYEISDIAAKNIFYSSKIQ